MSFDARALGALYPFESRSHDRRGLKLHYLDEGRGEPVLAVHGNPTWSFYYRNLALALRGRRRVIVPDHIGMGLSDKPGDDRYRYTLASRVEDLASLIDSLNLGEPLTLVVHDWGGAIGMAWAAANPERVARIVILNTAAFHPPARKKLPFTLRIGRNTPLAPILIRGMNAFARGATRMAAMKKLPPEVLSGYVGPYDSWANRIATLRFVQDIPLAPGDPAYATISEMEARLPALAGKPMLIAWGMKDFVFDADYLEEWRRRFPEARVLTYERAGHYVLEDAREELIPAIEKFLDENPAQGGAR